MKSTGYAKWGDIVKNGKHYLAIGMTEVFIEAAPYPWHLAQSCEPGGSHRLEIATSVWFRGKHESGLVLRWSLDIEGCKADGKGHYEILIADIDEAMKHLPPKAARQFSAYLSGCADAVQKKGEEWDEIAKRQFETVRQLRRAAAL